MNEIEKVSKIVREQVGYLEKASDKNLDAKQKNAGSANITKYGRDLAAWFPELGDTFGKSYAWCLQIIVWCFCIALGLERAKEALCGCLSAYTPTMAQSFMDAGRWGNSPQEGALIFFADAAKKSADRPYGIYHVGFVRSYDNNKVHTTEGNTSSSSEVVANGGCVANKSYALDNPKIYGYGYPKYDTYEHEWADETEHAALVTDIWVDVLYRKPKPEELAAELKKSHLRDTLHKVLSSEEGDRIWIRTNYLLSIGREPREDEIMTWYSALLAGASKAQVLGRIKNSLEAERRRLKN